MTLVCSNTASTVNLCPLFLRLLEFLLNLGGGIEVSARSARVELDSFSECLLASLRLRPSLGSDLGTERLFLAGIRTGSVI